MNPQVLILMGSDSDYPVMEETVTILNNFGVASEIHVSSAHRSPKKTASLVADAPKRGVRVIIAAAGAAAHLPGVIAAETILPVIGVPLSGTALNGVDALYAIVQMPAGVPVATMAIGKAGAKNAAILAVQMLALADQKLVAKLEAFKLDMEREVEEKDLKLQERS
jgi:5-(carboxyamino)imidazole ribonucleotide mutase